MTSLLVHCDVFAGVVGKTILMGMSFIAFSCYIGAYIWRKHYRIDNRSHWVFAMDMMKIGIGQIFAWGINLLNTHRNAQSLFDPLSWYFPTFLGDELISVPLGVFIGKMVQRLARYGGGDYECIHEFGRYHKSYHSDDPQWQNLYHAQVDIVPKCSWFIYQTATWVCCVVLSRLLGGLFIPFVYYIMETSSPFYLMTQWIYNLPWSCATKQWVFVGFFRLIIDVIQIAFVDYFNKYNKKQLLDHHTPV